MKSIDLVGHRFGRLTVIGATRHRNRFHWECKCECGKLVPVIPYNLINKIAKSCGCFRRENSSIINKKHGLESSSIYRLFQGIKRRCYNKYNKDYKNYGARGIVICDEWLHDIRSFYDWCMKNGYEKGLHIERNNNDMNYSPENCSFVTPAENNRNKRNKVFIELDGRKYRPFELEKIHKIPAKNLRDRVLYRKWSVEKAISTPVGTIQPTKNSSMIQPEDHPPVLVVLDQVEGITVTILDTIVKNNC